MKRCVNIALTILIIFATYSLQAQQEETILQTLEDLEYSGEDIDLLLDAIEKRNNNLTYKYNINDMSREDMMLLGLNNFQIFSLQNYILRTGELLSLNELQFINGFDSITINNIIPYLYAAHKTRRLSLKLDSIFKYAKQNVRLQYIQNLKTPYGFTRNDGKGFKGDNFSSSLRYNLKYYDRMELSLVGEKDYGEPLYYKNKTYGFDHYALSLTLRDLTKHLKQITIGNYRLNIGEGLAMKQNFSLGYMSDNMGAKHSANTISHFRSVSEYNYNSGIALKTEWKHLEITAFGSYNKIDFNGKSIQQTGYHRTQNELSQKDSNAVALLGTTLQYWKKGLNIGLTVFAYHYKLPIIKGTQKYQQFDFEGKNNSIIAINSSYMYKNAIFFSEFARSGNNAFAQTVGLQVNISYKHTLSLILRNYAKDYQNHYADAIGYHSYNKNERGIYLDYARYLNKHLSYFLGMDVYYFPFMAYRADKSSWGGKIKTQLKYTMKNKHTFDLFFRLNNHQYNATINNSKEIKNNIVSQWQGKYTHLFSDNFTLTSRIGYSHSFTYESNSNNGYFAYLESIINTNNKKIVARLRYAYFHSSDYDNRFYVYEYSLPLMFSSAMLYNTGHKFYTVLTYKPTKQLNLHLRYTLTRYNHTSEISSANTLVQGNILHYLGGQIYFSF